MSNPYRTQGTREDYSDSIQPAQLIALPWTTEARQHRMDRFTWINLRHMITEGPNGKVAITFRKNDVSYIYPSFFALRRDLQTMYEQQFRI